MTITKRLLKGENIILIACGTLLILRFSLHYLELGFFEFIIFELVPRWWLFALPLAFLMYSFHHNKLRYTNLSSFVITGVTFWFVYYVITPTTLDMLDWRINYSKRQEIVKLAKEKKLRRVSATAYRIPTSLTLFPFIKSSTISVEYKEDSTLTVTFYTDRGLVDHYSGFIYSNSKEDIRDLEAKVLRGGNDLKKERNWYFIQD